VGAVEERISTAEYCFKFPVININASLHVLKRVQFFSLVGFPGSICAYIEKALGGLKIT